LLSLKVYPDGSLTCSQISSVNSRYLKAGSGNNRYLNKPLPGQPGSPEYAAWISGSVAEAGLDRTIQAAAALGLSTLSNSSKTSPLSLKRRPRGHKGITSHGRRVVRFGAADLSDRLGRPNLSFLTCTLPALPDPIMIVVLGEWSRLLQNFRRKLAYHLSDSGLPASIIGVTEVQERRFENEGGLPLHIHWIFAGRKPGRGWMFRAEDFQKWWSECVTEITGNIEGISWDTSTRIESIRKDAAGYIGKYMSKGCNAVRKINELGWEWLLPSSWYTATKDIRASYKKNLYKVVGVKALALMSFLNKSDSSLLSWRKDLIVSSPDGTPIYSCWVARISRDMKPRTLVDILKQEITRYENEFEIVRKPVFSL
jgi:hypothetical protein